MNFAYIVTVTPKLGQDAAETFEAIEGVLSDLKDFEIIIEPIRNEPASR